MGLFPSETGFRVSTYPSCERNHIFLSSACLVCPVMHSFAETVQIFLI
ncbi:hypothetical protein IWX87_000058 [Polaromonas sp. CG_9.7]|nr:hypothetical protein [Polaromonas sp. CG_9.7]MBG6112316.1 hypothetical protein [Polaromonas sp. CG_9.2]MDH6183962.1 hypothetical protein [Polaromonas sp. CG_23.6]